MNHSAVYRFFFGSLRRQLIMGVAMVHAVMMSLFVWDLTCRQERMLLERQSEHAAALSESLAVSAAGWLAANDIAGLQELVASQERYPDLAFALLTNVEGKVLAHTDRGKIGLTVIDLPENPQPAVISNEKALVDTAVPAMLRDRHVGWARVGIGQKVSSSKLSQMTRDGILYALTAIIVGAVLAWLMGRKVTRRLHAIQGTIEKVKSGAGLCRTCLGGVDEPAVLSREFDSMLDTIAMREGELKEVNSRLEGLVEARTVELNNSLLEAERYANELQRLNDELTGSRAVFAQTARELETIIDAFPGLVFYKDTENRFLRVNKFFADAHHMEKKDLEGRNCLEIYPEKEAQAYWDDDKAVLAEGRPRLGIVEPWQTGEGRKWVLTSKIPYQDVTGKAIGVIGVSLDITERVQIEDRLKESEERFRSLFDHSPDAYLIMESDTGRISACNAAAETMLRGDRSRIIGMTPDRVSPERQPDGRLSAEVTAERIRESLQNGKHDFEWVHRRLDGTDFWVHVTLSVVNMDGRRVLFVAWRDIDDRKQMEEAKEKVSIRYQTLLAVAGDGIHVLDSDGNLLESSVAFRHMLGYVDDDILHLNVKDWDAGIPLENLPHTVRKLIQSSATFETKHRRKDGSIFDVEVNACGILLDGQPYLYASSRDISTRKEMETSLRESKQLLYDIFEFLPDATFVVDHDKKVIAWNQAIELMSGINKTKMIGKGDNAYTIPFYGVRRQQMLDLLDVDDEELRSRYANVVRHGRCLVAESFCNALNNGKGAYVWSIAAPLYDHDGNRIGAIQSIRDITERRRLEDELRRSNVELEQFAYVASHDLRAPLRAIDSLSEWLAQDLGDNLPPESAEHLKLLRGRVKRMEGLLDSLLEYSRIGRAQTTLEMVDVREVVDEIAELSGLSDRFVVVTDQLPVFNAYATPFVQVLRNLIGNAVKHHDKGKGTIVVNARELDTYYEFSVVDDGPGIPEQFREKVFGMFQTLRPRDEVEGSGMGLALVKKAVEYNGGTVRLDAAVPRGTRVTFTWPITVS